MGGGEVGGYIRIPSYTPEDLNRALNEFALIMIIFDRTASRILIDQLSNPGGLVSYLYSLVAMLSGGKTLQIPKHKQVLDPSQALQFMQKEKILKVIDADQSSRQVLGEYFQGIPVSLELVSEMRKSLKAILESWQSTLENPPARHLTPYVHLVGPSQVNPMKMSPVSYRGPLGVLINALCFSGRDFLPHILRGNRLKVFES